MVSIKSLAVLLFVAAVTAAPVVGDEYQGGHDGRGVNVHDSSNVCSKQEQKIYCCNDAEKDPHFGPYTGFLDKIAVKCNSVPVNVLAVDVASAVKQCSAKAACCSSYTNQNGLANIDLGCFAIVPN
ncbi:hypothetical protein C7212DRAFT_366215 [Tuber magnatum]|uniref:Hydrophobin n=1 Tax=Tuber magnatum TaxID=42249 RepID=A0A317SG86_9PEZI|nr:hypothetical protein C7212DRAFT_366215 [Tuber magnatum]